MGMLLPAVLPAADRVVLSARVRAAKTSVGDMLRAQIVLTAVEHGARGTAAAVGCAVSTVVKWVSCYRAHGLQGLGDLHRSGAPRHYDDVVRRCAAAVATSLCWPFARWSHARIAAVLAGPSPSWVGRALKDAQLRVHRVRGWLHRKEDPLFEDRIAAIEAAVAAARAGTITALSVDEKTALGVRTPIHPDTRGPDGAVRREFEYRRAGTVAWYGTQDVTSGKTHLIRAEGRMHSAAFTMVLDDLVAAHADALTLIMDNGSTHTSGETRRWMGLHPDVRILFIPVHASWANPVEVQFSILTRQVITGGWFTSSEDLDAAAQRWTQIRNQHPRPVSWSYQRVPRTCDVEH